MADDPKKRGLDAKLVSQQRHELDHLKDKHGITLPAAKKVAQEHGPSRKKVEAAIPAAKKATAKRPTPKK